MARLPDLQLLQGRGNIHGRKRWFALIILCVAFQSMAPGCMPMPSGQGGQEGSGGPGHRRQRLKLTPSQELSLGRQAYKEVLDKAQNITKEQGKDAEGALLPA